MTFKERIKKFIASFLLCSTIMSSVINSSNVQADINKYTTDINKFQQTKIVNLNIQDIKQVKQQIENQIISAQKWIEESEKLKEIFPQASSYPVYVMSSTTKDIYLYNMKGNSGFLVVDKDNYNNGYFLPFGSADVKDLKGNSIDPVLADFHMATSLINIDKYTVGQANKFTDLIIQELNNINRIFTQLEQEIEIDNQQINSDETNNQQVNSQQIINFIKKIQPHMEKINSYMQFFMTDRATVPFISGFFYGQSKKIENPIELEQYFNRIENMDIKIKHDHIPSQIKLSELDKYTKDIVNQLNKQTGKDVNVKNIIQKTHNANFELNGYHKINSESFNDVIGFKILLPNKFYNQLLKDFYITKESFLDIILHEYGHAVYNRERLLDIFLTMTDEVLNTYSILKAINISKGKENPNDGIKLTEIQKLKMINDKLMSLLSIHFERKADEFVEKVIGQNVAVKGFKHTVEINKHMVDTLEKSVMKNYTELNIIDKTEQSHINTDNNNNTEDFSKNFINENTGYDIIKSNGYPQDKERLTLREQLVKNQNIEQKQIVKKNIFDIKPVTKTIHKNTNIKNIK